MRLLIDAQLPHSLCHFFRKHGVDAMHTLELPNGNRTADREIILLAQKESRIVVTKDSDFINSFIISGQPEKLVVVRTGNISNDQLLQIFEQNLELLMQAISRSKMVEVSRTGIAEHD